jgi:hypothetical protein
MHSSERHLETDHTGTKAATAAILVLFAIPHTILALAMVWATIRTWSTNPDLGRALLSAAFALLSLVLWRAAVMLSRGRCTSQQRGMCRLASFGGAGALVVYAVAGVVWVSQTDWDEMTTMMYVISVAIPLLEAVTLVKAGLLLRQDSPGVHWQIPSSLPPTICT